jgi:hypothetical protein
MDFNRIKSNIGKMIDMGAPESDIDAYIAEEGVTPEMLRGEQGAQVQREGKRTLGPEIPFFAINGNARWRRRDVWFS